MRHWCSGYHSTFPTLRPGFDSRMAHYITFFIFEKSVILIEHAKEKFGKRKFTEYAVKDLSGYT